LRFDDPGLLARDDEGSDLTLIVESAGEVIIKESAPKLEGAPNPDGIDEEEEV
jgi:hypothetical protein